MSSTIEQLKADLQLKHGLKLIDADRVKTTPGVPTGWSDLDGFLSSGGFPCGEISLLEGAEGLGALTLWLETAALVTTSGQRVAWLNSADDDREPMHLHAPTAQARGVDLHRLYLVSTPTRQKRAWILQELLASNLFSLVGCDLGEAHIPLREARALLMQARRSGAAVVLFYRRVGERETREPPALRALASLVLNFAFSSTGTLAAEVVRAAHRPVPHNLPISKRGERHVDFITGSDTNSRALTNTSTSAPSSSISGSISGALDPRFILAHARGRD